RDPGVLRTGQASAPEDAHGHVEIAPVLLAQDVRRKFRGAEQGMQALVHRQVFADSVASVGVFPAGWELLQRKLVGPVAIDLVGRGEAERSLRTTLSRGDQQVERGPGIDVKVLERNRRRLVMRRLRRSMNDKFGARLPNQRLHASAI